MINTTTQDTTIICRQCGQEFSLTAVEQLAFAKRGQGRPEHCAFCRAARMIASGGVTPTTGAGRADRQVYLAVCSDCGRQTSLPFEPRGGRPVYCSNCYKKHSLADGGRSRSRSYDRR